MAQNCQNRRKTDVYVLTPAPHNPRLQQIVIFYMPRLFITPTEATQLCIIITAHAQV